MRTHPMSLSRMTIAARLALATQPASATQAPQAPVPDAFAAMAQTLSGPETTGEKGRETPTEAEFLSTPRAGDVPDDQEPPAAESTTPKKPGAARVCNGVSEASLENRRLALLVGSRIRAAREANGVQQFDLAKAIGHANSTQVSLWESGKRLAPMSEVPGLAKALDTSADFLLGLTDDMDADPSAARRGLLVQHLRDQLEAVAGSLADVALESGLELEGSIRNSKLLTRCEAVRVALDRFRAANEAQFDDLRGGALLERTMRELMEAANAVGAELDGVGQRRERAARATREAMAAGTC